MEYLLWILLSCGVVLSWIKLNKFWFADTLSPFNLLLFSWIGPLLLRGLNLSEYEHPWRMEIYVVMIIVTFGLITPLLVAHPFIRSRPLAAQQPIFQRMLVLFQDNRFISLMVIFYIISFIAFIYNDFITNPAKIPLITLIQDPLMPREAFHRWGRTGGPKVGLLMIPLYVLTPMFYLSYKVNNRGFKKFIMIGFALLYPIMIILKLSRIEFIQASMNIFLVEYYYRRFLSQRMKSYSFRRLRYVIVVIGLIIGIALTTTELQKVRGGFEAESRAVGKLIGYKPDIPVPFYGLAAEMYGYFAMPLENFANFYKANPEGGFNPGIGFFRPLLSITGQGRLADAMIEKVDLLDGKRLWPVNTYPFITLIYAELGLIGVFVVSLLYGGMVSFFYVRFRRRPTFTSFFLYLTCPFGWLWLFSSAGFTVLAFYLYLSFVIGFYLLYEVLFVKNLKERSPRGL